MKSEVDAPSKFLNVILIILGLYYGSIGIINSFNQFIRGMEYYGSILRAIPYIFYYSTFGLYTILGVWIIITSIIMLKEKLWAMGGALVVLSIMFFLFSIPTILSRLFNPMTDFSIVWILTTSVKLTLEIVGFFWVLATLRKYNRSAESHPTLS